MGKLAVVSFETAGEWETDIVLPNTVAGGVLCSVIPCHIAGPSIILGQSDEERVEGEG